VFPTLELEYVEMERVRRKYVPLMAYLVCFVCQNWLSVATADDSRLLYEQQISFAQGVGSGPEIGTSRIALLTVDVEKYLEVSSYVRGLYNDGRLLDLKGREPYPLGSVFPRRLEEVVPIESSGLSFSYLTARAPDVTSRLAVDLRQASRLYRDGQEWGWSISETKSIGRARIVLSLMLSVDDGVTELALWKSLMHNESAVCLYFVIFSYCSAIHEEPSRFPGSAAGKGIAGHETLIANHPIGGAIRLAGAHVSEIRIADGGAHGVVHRNLYFPAGTADGNSKGDFSARGISWRYEASLRTP